MVQRHDPIATRRFVRAAVRTCGAAAGAAAFLAGVLLAPSIAAAATTCDFTKVGTTQACTLSYSDANGAQMQNIRMRIPNGIGSAPPVVIYLHGAPGGEYECDGSGWPEKCDAAGCVLVCPRGSVAVNGGHSWNTLYGDDDPNDVEYVRQILDMLASGLASDPTRQFVTGFSAGGWMTHRLGFELSDRLAAFGTIASSLYIRDIGNSITLPDTVAPISVIHLQGSADASVFYCGKTANSVTVASQDETFDYWSGAQGNQCSTFETTSPFCTTTHGATAPGGTLARITSNKASDCKNGAEVVHYELVGGQHSYYGTASLTTPPGNASAP